jgi:hypothetical protein
MGRKDQFNKKLLVEGKDDQHVILALCQQFKISENFEIIDCEGIEKLNNQIPVRFKQSGIEVLGIIIDADTEIKNRWNSLKDTLSLQGFIVPNELPSNGLILENSLNVKVGVWIMPNNDLNGMLEDFISFLIPKNDMLFPIVNSAVNDIESKQLNKYSPLHKSKAIIHTWLAWQEVPGTPMGLSITKRYLSTDENNCLLLMDWINKLFN